MLISDLLKEIEAIEEEADLLALHRTIVRKINSIRRMKSWAKALDFKEGDPVIFDAGRRMGVLLGNIVKMNPKSAKIRTASGLIWNVSYNFIRHDPITTAIRNRA